MNKVSITSIALLIALIPFSLSAFDGYSPVGARQAGMGRASVASTDFWSIHNNPAGIALATSPAAGLAYENRFLMKELSLKSAGFVLPVNYGVLGLSFNQFGYKLYNENKLGLAYSLAFSPSLRMGLQLDYLGSRAEGYDGYHHLTFEYGVQYELNSRFSVAATVFNPIGVGRSQLTNERIPVVARLGVGYRFTEKIQAIAEIEKSSDFSPDLRVGLEYALQERFYVRTGVGVKPGNLTFGAGWDLGPLQLDLAAGIHEVLGSNLQASLVYSFRKKGGK